MFLEATEVAYAEAFELVRNQHPHVTDHAIREQLVGGSALWLLSWICNRVRWHQRGGVGNEPTLTVAVTYIAVGRVQDPDGNWVDVGVPTF